MSNEKLGVVTVSNTGLLLVTLTSKKHKTKVVHVLPKEYSDWSITKRFMFLSKLKRNY